MSKKPQFDEFSALGNNAEYQASLLIAEGADRQQKLQLPTIVSSHQGVSLFFYL
jgi:hypothetical protein